MKPIYILGGHHGDYEAVFSALKERGIRDATVIHVGDGAEGFPDWRATTSETLDKRFAALGIQYLSIRGNHSDPAFFWISFIVGGRWFYQTPRVRQKSP